MWLHSEASSREAGMSEVASPPPPCGRSSFTKAEAARPIKASASPPTHSIGGKPTVNPASVEETTPDGASGRQGVQGLSAQQSAHSMPSWEMPTLSPAAA